MRVDRGTRLGPYEVGAPLGAGGMGEVYRARDTKLGREVALKSLPEAFAAHPDGRVLTFVNADEQSAPYLNVITGFPELVRRKAPQTASK